MIVLDRIGESDLGPDLEKHLRHVFFQGGRDIALTGKNRHAILRHGVPGLLESLSGERRGLLARLDLAAAWNDVARMSDDGNFHADSIDPDFADYAAPDDRHRHDAILGTIGGGNHFVEFGMVERIADGGFAHLAGLKADSVVVVVHPARSISASGSARRRANGRASRRRVLAMAFCPRHATAISTGVFSTATPMRPTSPS